jgi:hypothetical protein
MKEKGKKKKKERKTKGRGERKERRSNESEQRGREECAKLRVKGGLGLATPPHELLEAVGDAKGATGLGSDPTF